MDKSAENVAPVLSYSRPRKVNSGGECFRDGAFLATGGDATLPQLCVVCGRGGAGDVEFREFGGWNQITWSRAVTLKCFFCARHSARRLKSQKILSTVAGILCGAAILGLVATTMIDFRPHQGAIHVVLFCAALAAVVMGLVLGVGAPGGPAFERRAGAIYYFSGVHADVLEALPELGEIAVTVEKVAFDSPRGREALAVRMEVFVREQKVPEEIERDEYDASAAHFVAIELGKVIGTARVVRKGEVAKIGRVAVLMEKRAAGVGRKLMIAAIAEAKAMGVSEMMLTAQVAVIGFYEKLGFVAEGDVFEEAGIPHRKMKCDVAHG